jgi:hypothetical protein
LQHIHDIIKIFINMELQQYNILNKTKTIAL